jgi:hypothetical protein
VFVSYRGPDVRKTFVSHLYRRLVSCGLKVLLGPVKNQEGFDLASQTASAHVPIFTPGYAGLSRCLDELLMMLESKATIIPVLYNVKRSKLWWTHARALRRLGKKTTTTIDPLTHKKTRRHDPATMEKWRKALSDVSDISGFDLEAFNGMNR